MWVPSGFTVTPETGVRPRVSGSFHGSSHVMSMSSMLGSTPVYMVAAAKSSVRFSVGRTSSRVMSWGSVVSLTISLMTSDDSKPPVSCIGSVFRTV